MFNPYIALIEGDLSRADFVALAQLCRGKDVVEFGAGASTILFAQVAKSVTCYETKQDWLHRVSNRLFELEKDHKVCPWEIKSIDETRDGSSVKGLSRPCDVLFDDGWAMMRAPFLLEFWQDVRECAILHDTRATYAANVLKVFFNSFISPPNKETQPWGHPYAASLKRIEWNYLESNLAVLHRRDCELLWENWNVTEEENNRKDRCG